MTWQKRLGVVALVLVVAAGIGRSVGPARDIPAGTGYAAMDLCTRTMQSQQPLDVVRKRYVEPRVRPLPLIWNVDMQAGSHVTVSSLLPTLRHPRTAIHRPGLGCTLITPDTDAKRVRAQAFKLAPELPPDSTPWPLGEGAAETGLVTDSARTLIERHADRIFSEPIKDPNLQRNATALLIARDGHLIFERYAPGNSREQAQLGWSMTKTLTAIIAGVLAGDGKLTIDGEVGLPQWQGTPKQKITWRNLLNMAPGLAWFEGYDGRSDATDMLFSQADQGAWAADRPLTSTPGKVFTYSTGFTNIAMLRMRQLVGGQPQAIYDYYQQRLFAPLGIRHGVIEPDASGTPVGGARGVLRPVDWLRLGQLVANGGRWNDTPILPADYVTFMAAPSPADAGYGGSIWRVAASMIDPKLRAQLPDDLIFFAGVMSQFMLVVPSRNLVVLRMGATLGSTMEREPARTEVFTLVAELLRNGSPSAASH